mgnify:CR=1 FL=1
MNISNEKVQVYTRTLKQLFENPFILDSQTLKFKIDSYQRDYVWNKKKVRQLLNDIKEHNESAHYYLGSLLFHLEKESNHLYIIDGQQRLTTLAILFFLKEGRVPKHFELTYPSKNSKDNIKFIQKEFDSKNANILVEKMGRIDLTITITDSQDQAFAFFDSQNTRGVRLSATDLLKSFHLRKIVYNKDLSRDAAIRWENLQANDTVLIKDKKRDSAYELFERIVWRIRNWSRNNLNFEVFDSVLNEFENNRATQKPNEIPLFSVPANQDVKSLIMKRPRSLVLKQTEVIDQYKPKDIPIVINQPLFDGYFFFIYGERYSEILKEINERAQDPRLGEFLFDSDVSFYLKELLLNTVMAYRDRFGWSTEFGQFFELTMVWFLMNRLEKANFREQSPITMLREINIFEIIESSYDPNDLIRRFSQKIINNKKEDATVNKEGDILENKKEKLGGIRKRYYKTTKHMFSNHLVKNRWIKWERVIKEIVQNYE